jgi:hypothetical protein
MNRRREEYVVYVDYLFSPVIVNSNQKNCFIYYPNNMSEYDLQAKEFLEKTGTTITKEFV